MEPHLQHLCEFFDQEDSSFLATLASINDDTGVVEPPMSSRPAAAQPTTRITKPAILTADKPKSSDSLKIIRRSDLMKPETKAAESGAPGSPYFKYKDFSELPDPNPSVPVTAPGRIPNFPAKMYAILSRRDLQDIVSWMPHGRSWKVHKPREFEIKVIPTYFEHSKFSSFIRQANGWGFRRMISKGPDRNSYYHEMFLRSTPHLVKLMKRPPPSSKPIADASTEPDFYRIAEEKPLPELKAKSEECNFAEEAQNILAHCKLVERPMHQPQAFVSRKKPRTSMQHGAPAYISSSAQASPRAVAAAPMYVASSHEVQHHYAPSAQHSYPTQYQSHAAHYYAKPAEHVASSPVASHALKADSHPKAQDSYCIEPLPVDSAPCHTQVPNLADVFIEGFKPSDDSFWLVE